MNTSFPTTSAPRGRFSRGLSWTLRILAAAVFLAAGSAKLAGVPMMIEVFEHIGIGQWFRFFTGAVEIAGAIALLLPRTFAFSGAMLAAMMLVATFVHLFIIGGSPAPAIVLMLITATIAWLHRGHFVSALRYARST